MRYQVACSRLLKSKKKKKDILVPVRDWRQAQWASCAGSSPEKNAKAETIEDAWLAQLDLHIDTYGIFRDGYVWRIRELKKLSLEDLLLLIGTQSLRRRQT